MRADRLPLISALALLASCLVASCGGEETGEVGVSISGLPPDVSVVRVAFHQPDRSCGSLKAEPLAKAIKDAIVAVADTAGGTASIEELPAGKYTVIAHGGPNERNTKVFACVEQQTIQNGKRTRIQLVLAPL